MIHIFASFFDSAAKTGKKQGAAERIAEGKPVSGITQEHLAGRRLLLAGLRELYDLFPASAEKEPEGEGLPEAFLSEDILPEEILPEETLPDKFLEEGKNGKPYLKEHPDIHFNISHCDGLAVCAFANGPVGVDVETVRPIRPSLVRRVLHEKEQAVLNRYRETAQVRMENGKEVPFFTDPEKERDYDRVFFRYWTLKESFLKRDGSGLTRELQDVFFDLDPENWEAPVYGLEDETVCRQYRIRGSEEFLLSVCTARETDKEEVCFHWDRNSGVPVRGIEEK